MVLDIITCLVVAFGFYSGFSRGLIKTIFAALSLLVGIVATMKLSDITRDLIEKVVNLNEGVTFALGFVITFIVVMALIRFIGDRIDKLFESLHIGGVNKLLGGLFLGLFYAIIISFAVYFGDKLSLISDNVKSASFTYPLLEPLPRATQGVGESLRPLFSEFWDKMIEAMDAAKEKGEALEN